MSYGNLRLASTTYQPKHTNKRFCCPTRLGISGAVLGVCLKWVQDWVLGFAERVRVPDTEAPFGYNCGNVKQTTMPKAVFIVLLLLAPLALILVALFLGTFVCASCGSRICVKPPLC